jgi:hypothetical protein
VNRRFPVVEAPPVTDIGFNVKELGPKAVPGGTTVSRVLRVVPL